LQTICARTGKRTCVCRLRNSNRPWPGSPDDRIQFLVVDFDFGDIERQNHFTLIRRVAAYHPGSVQPPHLAFDHLSVIQIDFLDRRKTSSPKAIAGIDPQTQESAKLEDLNENCHTPAILGQIPFHSPPLNHLTELQLSLTSPLYSTLSVATLRQTRLCSLF